MMLIQGGVAKYFQREVVNTTVYTMNWILVKRGKDKTPYEYRYGRSPNVNYFKIFGSKCFIKRGDYVSKFEAKSDEGIFPGYSTKSKAYKCYNNQRQRIIESVDVQVDEYPEVSVEISVEKKDEGPCILFLELEPVKSETDKENVVVPVQLEQVDLEEDDDNEDNDGVLTRRRIRENSCMISTIKPRTAKKAFGDDHWVKDMEEELDQIEKNNTWILVSIPVNKNAIGTKWVFRNKLNEDGVVVRNKLD